MEPTGPRPAHPQLRLDDLLSELQARLQTVVATRDRVYTLLEAVVAVGTTLDLETVLKQIVEAAITLVRARYGALGIIGEGGRLVEFVPVGLADGEIEAIHHWPEGRGLLGALITNPRPLRLPDISGSPKSSGFPPGHPPMQSFLGVTVRVRDEVYGNLYLTEKEGGAEFDEEDEALLVALAAAAGVAIDNAKLYEEGRRQQRWLRASSEVTRRLLSGDPPDEVLALVTRQALELSGADLVALALPTPDRQQLVIQHAAGAGAPEATGLVLPVSASVSGEVLTSGQAVTWRTSATMSGWRARPGSTCRSGRPSSSRWAHPGTSAACSRWAATPGRCRWPPRRSRWSRPSRRRRVSPSNSPSTARTRSGWPSSPTATGSPGTCMTSLSSGSTPRACPCRGPCRC